MQTAGWVLLVASLLVLAGYGVFFFARGFFADDSIPLAVRVAVPAAVAGLLLVLGGVVRERLASRRREHFEEMEP